MYYILMENVYIALIINVIQGYDLSQYNLVIDLFNSQYPNNLLVFDKYLINGSIQQTNAALESFITKYPQGQRVTVSSTTGILTKCSNFMILNNLDILNISVSASANFITQLVNAISYAPAAQYSVMSIFMIYQDYQMNEINVLYEKNTNYDSFFNDYINSINIQASLLNIKVTINILEAGIINYNINPKSLIVMLATTTDLTNIFVTPDFLHNIPTSSFIIL